ncbi:YfiT family bacillithiol transferase [Limnoglobus roseus]|uniref:Metal-dependent hydrolase n=1 Tax=Limnoglobus roseus TaxID=2598579 RepID=A0A5C1A7T5_9BACT|nr:putative metal-dependent hydrolase [Limnoglobus roseus]QEL13912.1 metal-dependent hydrolase [Limnoglobus roseus]
MPPPNNPAGEYRANTTPTAAERLIAIEAIAELPRELRAAVSSLGEADLDTVYKKWTIRQIVHHIADSHVNLFIRFKLALTGDTPRINPYNETAFAELADARELPVEVSLQLLDATHARLTHLLQSVPEAAFARGYFHPEHGRVISLNETVGNYAWHGRHHTGQILWLRQHRLGK